MALKCDYIHRAWQALPSSVLNLDQQIYHLHNCFIYVTNNNNNNNNILLKIRNITNYITFPPQIAYELIEAGRSEDI